MFARSAPILNLPRLAAALLLALAAVAAPAAGEAAKPQPGDPAPAISLPDQNGKTVNLADYRGQWVVVYFYPKDETPGCTTQACEFRDNIFAFRRAGAQILGISVDDVESHRKFAENHGLPFPLLADSSHETTQRYGVLNQSGPAARAARETFLVDPNGKIVRHYVVGRDDLEGHSKVVLADIESLKATAKKG
ncbi:MAG: peroxiredoxin [Steroidobacteraceae bacterium]